MEDVAGRTLLHQEAEDQRSLRLSEYEENSHGTEIVGNPDRDNHPDEYRCFHRNPPRTWLHPGCKPTGILRYHRRGAQRTCLLQGDSSSDRAGKEGNGRNLGLARHGGMNNTYEPPLVESVLLEGSLRPVVVGEVLSTDVVPPRRRVRESLTGISSEGSNSSFEGTRY